MKRPKTRNWLAVRAFTRKGAGTHGSARKYKRRPKHKGAEQ